MLNYSGGGQGLLLELCNLYIKLFNLYLMVKDREKYYNAASKIIVKWSLSRIHPYYPPEVFNIDPDTDWGLHWTLLLTGTGLCGFSVRKFIKDLYLLYTDTIAIFTLLYFEYGEDTEAKKFYYESGFGKGTGYDLYKEFTTEKHNTKTFIRREVVSGIPRFKFGLKINEISGKIEFLPEIHSVFDYAYYALSRIAAADIRQIDDWGSKKNLTFCSSCGKLFIKTGNNQRYCNDPLCQAYRNQKKSRDCYYRRKLKKDQIDLINKILDSEIIVL